MSWFEKLLPSIHTNANAKKGVPEGLWRQCKPCQAILYRPELERNGEVCPKCEYHFRLNARKRIEQFLDTDTETVEIGGNCNAVDWLKFRDSKKYKDRLTAAQKNSNETEALLVRRGTLEGQPIIAAAMDFSFMGGSMGAVVGERFVQAVEECLTFQLPFVCFSASGGARMQEGLTSLLQMGKTSAALTKLAEHRLPYISVLTDPTTGGVSASFAFLGDIIIAEPNALIGFAGPRVIEQTVRETLPEGFQRSEFLLEHGAIDMIVDRRKLRETIARLLKKLHH